VERGGCGCYGLFRCRFLFCVLPRHVTLDMSSHPRCLAPSHPSTVQTLTHGRTNSQPVPSPCKILSSTPSTHQPLPQRLNPINSAGQSALLIHKQAPVSHVSGHAKVDSSSLSWAGVYIFLSSSLDMLLYSPRLICGPLLLSLASIITPCHMFTVDKMYYPPLPRLGRCENSLS